MFKDIKLIILDRDGVINVDSTEYIKSPNEWHPIPGSLLAISRLNQAGYKVVVATNQSGISRKLFKPEDLEAIHKKMQDELTSLGGHLDGIFICPHGPHDDCECRKPKAGLLWQISRTFNIPPEKILSIGDSMRDLESAETFGCKFILVLTGNGENTLKIKPSIKEKFLVAKDLAAAVALLLTKC